MRLANDQKPHVLSNAKLFTEGVDVPALNAIAFLDPRNSPTDTMQAVGRVMRRDPNNPHKEFGYVIVPVVMAPGADLAETLDDKSRFESLGNVLRAWLSHDESFETNLHVLLGEVIPDEDSDNDKKPPTHDVNIQESIVNDQIKRGLYAQMADNAGIGNIGQNVVDEIGEYVRRAANILLKNGVAKLIADTIGTPLNDAKESCTTAALLIVNACIMHKRLDATGNLYGLTTLETANNAENPPQAFYDAWLTILKKDYRPIFQDAAALMNKFAPLSECHRAIEELALCAMDKTGRLNDLGFDHAGPLYHRILGSAKSEGAYYTENLSA